MSYMRLVNKEVTHWTKGFQDHQLEKAQKKSKTEVGAISRMMEIYRDPSFVHVKSQYLF